MSRMRVAKSLGILLVIALSGLAACSPIDPSPSTPTWTFPRRGTLRELSGVVEARPNATDPFRAATSGLRA